MQLNKTRKTQTTKAVVHVCHCVVVDGAVLTGNNSHSASAGSQNRLYSYMSGSEGEEDQLRPTGRRLRRRDHDRVPASAPPGHGDAAVDALSSCSSLSSVHSSSPSDVEQHAMRLVSADGVGQPGVRRRRSVDRLTDTLDSGSGGRIGENVYSRIKEPGLYLYYHHNYHYYYCYCVLCIRV